MKKNYHSLLQVKKEIMLRKNLLIAALEAALEAGHSVSSHYKRPFDIENKTDGSPITEADRQAHSIILRFLEKTGIPVLSEESPDHSYHRRKNWKRFWLVDPLDGTREFIKRNNEFTVNIALIEDSKPVMGVILAPELNVAYMGIENENAWKIKNLQEFKRKHPYWQNQEIKVYAEPLRDLSLQESAGILGSRSHLDDSTLNLIEKIKSVDPGAFFIPMGSSLKFCLLAEKKATLYPRYSETSEWDIAAGHAILKAAGGEIYRLSNMKPLEYNKEDLKNPPFFAFANCEDSPNYFRKFSL